MPQPLTETVVLDPRFNGPPDSGQGGYCAGIVAEYCGPSAEVSLRRPIPLGVELTVERDAEGTVRLTDAEGVLVEGHAAEVSVDVPEPPTFDEAVEAAKRSNCLDPASLFNTCVVCGSAREPGDGFRIFPGPVEGEDFLAAPWIPDASLAGRDGVVRNAFVWAALDCPTGIPVITEQGQVILLARFAARLDRPIRAGERIVTVGWAGARDGRKLRGASAFFDEDGELRCVADALWISVDLPK